MKIVKLLWKNYLIKKKNFKSYFFTLFILNLGLFLIKTISISLNEQIVLKQNEIQYRSIMVEPIRDETFFSTLKNNLNIMEINNKEDYLEIIVSDFRHVKEITDVLEGKYFILDRQRLQMVIEMSQYY